eukprot:GEMP01035397.1.p1 GENE.GEMP01035397.1~~GEMP01035397.1.p1  ORF type:complete len:247 (+),score=52.57 GEMP01035397.1:133-873(+)
MAPIRSPPDAHIELASMPAKARTTKARRHAVMLVGDSGVGKSSIVARLADPQKPLIEVKPTVGVDHTDVDVQCEDGPIALKLYDPSGQDRFATLLRTYIKDVKLVIVVCDATSPQSFDSVSSWIECVQKHNKDAMICILANKFDAKERVMTTEDVVMLRKSLDMTNVVLIADCSAKNASGIQRLFEIIARKAAGLGEDQESPRLVMSGTRQMAGCCSVGPAQEWRMTGCTYRPASKKRMKPSVFDE